MRLFSRWRALRRPLRSPSPSSYADRVQLLLGPDGTDIAVRLSEFILFCLGIQILWSGGSELLKSVLHAGS